MAPSHLLLCFFGSADVEAVVHQAGALSAREGARLSVIVPIIDSTVPAGCCGIGSEHWKRLTNMDARESLEGAVSLLERAGCAPVNAGIEVGPSVDAIVRQAVERWACDAVCLARRVRPWSSAGLSRRRLMSLREATDRKIVLLEAS